MQETSMISWEEMHEKVGQRHEEIYFALMKLCYSQKDATDQEIKQFLGQLDANYVRPRRFELVNDFKLVGFSQKRKCRVTGKTAMAWKIVQRRLKDDSKMSEVQEIQTDDKTLTDRKSHASLCEDMQRLS